MSGQGAALKSTAKATSKARSTKRPLVDLAKLRKTSLRRYRKHFKLNVSNNPSKAELVEAVKAHFANQNVRENDAISAFISLTKKRTSKASNNE
eukprot:TRINITY_DN21552_c0_g1::TRINITY_DN21552_c0_g1_i1::g.14988::m.14988 TRINITY_DN21552_c0_g1::TRINITY_DN21552_c0_g1_i1::g.14988  ORF type:complete len:107 (-),score=10.27,sp/O88574/SAP30_MOUSE/40.91/5e-10,SAP30_Sin3_bdg/PF13867.1/8.7e+02,SAP30_Sin3_bdg/PF13867.1/3e-18 TRINITY_DN21552_c0_g1_i1:181-462(-)